MIHLLALREPCESERRYLLLMPTPQPRAVTSDGALFCKALSVGRSDRVGVGRYGGVNSNVPPPIGVDQTRGGDWNG
jgi:hypothetical protein